MLMRSARAAQGTRVGQAKWRVAVRPIVARPVAAAMYYDAAKWARLICATICCRMRPMMAVPHA